VRGRKIRFRGRTQAVFSGAAPLDTLSGWVA